MKRNNRKRILILELGHRVLRAVEARRGAGGACELRHTLPATLALDPWTADAQLVGREIRNLLTAAGMKPGACIVCVPAEMVLTHSLPLPELPEAELGDFLKLEAERAFPFAPEDLVVSTSLATLPDRTRRAFLGALLTTQADRLAVVARHAGLKLASITLATPALLAGEGSGAHAALALTLGGMELAVAADGNLIALRALGETESALREEEPDLPAITRECRITLARLPGGVRAALSAVEAYAFPALPAALKTALGIEFESLRLAFRPQGVNAAGDVVSGEASAHPPAGARVALRWLAGEAAGLEFLTPRVSRARQVLRQYMQRGLLWRVGGAAALALALVVLAMAWQMTRLARLEARWKGLEPRVKAASTLQQQIRDYRPWFDDGNPTLEIAKSLTTAFPVSGEVWARTLEIRDMTQVICTGYARSESAALKVHDDLLKTRGVEDLKISQLRGTNPLQFSLSYRWNPGGHDGQAQP